MSDPALSRLLTWHGALVGLAGEGGGIVAASLAQDEAGLTPLEFDPACLFAEGRPAPHPQLGLVTLRPSRSGRGATVSRYGRLLSVLPGENRLEFTATKAGHSEIFLMIPAADLEHLRQILTGRWIIRATRRVLQAGDIALRPGWHLQLGPAQVDIEQGLAALFPSGVGATAALDTVLLPGGAGELVRAERRSSALLPTDRWPVRARRTAELMALAAHRELSGVEPEPDVFDRDVTFLLDHGGPAGLSELLARMRPASAVPNDVPQADQATGEDDRLNVLTGWAMREMAPWFRQPAGRAASMARYAALNDKARWAFIYHFESGTVRLQDKPQMPAPNRVHEDRAQYYLRFFQSLTHLLPPRFQTTICAGVGDKVTSVETVPVFCFQKEAGATTLLLPDIDLLMNDFHESAAFADTVAYQDKIRRAVFAGATTGGLITPETARKLQLPRLRAAKYFIGNPDVDFRLPKIVQCTTPEVEAILRAQPFCQTEFMPWSEQLRHRFIISIDGNGATCSRVAISLSSNSVLMKYDSHDVLHYFGGLHPWDHFVPVAKDNDIAWIMAQEARDPETFARIAARGRAFAQAYLSRASAQLYTAVLLQLYATSRLDDSATPPPAAPRTPPPKEAAPAFTTVVAHVQQRGDLNTADNGWTGLPGSTLAIEGFVIHLGPELADGGLAYQAVLSDGARSDVARAGEYCGTRGENVPLLGLVIGADEAASRVLRVSYEVRFVDGTTMGPVQGGIVCQAESGAALEAFRLIIR